MENFGGDFYADDAGFFEFTGNNRGMAEGAAFVSNNCRGFFDFTSIC